jgi:biopolymer transport protein ExbD
MPLKARREEALELNLTPMIDVLFLLIIFFMAGAKFTDEVSDIDLQLPKVGAETPVNNSPHERVVSVEQSGAIRLDGESLSSEALGSALVKLREQDPNLRLSIWGDAGTEFQHVAEVLSACKIAGIRNMAVSVQMGQTR